MGKRKQARRSANIRGVQRKVGVWRGEKKKERVSECMSRIVIDNNGEKGG